MCCGRNRAAALAAVMATKNDRATPVGEGPASATSVMMFEYTGTDAISIRGPATGQLYRFNKLGDRVRVDPRDRPGLAIVSLLHWVR